MNHNAILRLLEGVQRELTRPQAYRDTPAQGQLVADLCELRLFAEHDTFVRIRRSAKCYQFRITVAEPPMPSPSAIRLAALLKQRKRTASWLNSVLPKEAKFADLMCAGGAYALRFEVRELPEAKTIAQCAIKLARRFEESNGPH